MMTPDILHTLKTAQTPLTRLELARAHSCSAPTIVKYIKPLVANGHVVRIEDRDNHRRLVYRYSLPQPDNPLQIRTFAHGLITLKCPKCGERRRLRHYRKVYLLECQCGHHQRWEAEKLKT